MKYFIGAYATAPSTNGWNSALETEYYKQLKTINSIKGLEHPFIGTLHPHDDNWFLNNIDRKWEFIFTSIPGVMGQLAVNPYFGIASDNEDGRQAALSFYRKASQAIIRLNEHLQKEAVTHIKVHTAPTISNLTSSSKDALKQSLEEMQSWDWQGAKIVVEHCDAYIKEQPAEKGFMKLEDEIATIIAVNGLHNSDIGISINWGRSAIEARS